MKIIVGVHGVGDQKPCETIQAIHRRFACYYGVTPALPLGRLRSALESESGVYVWPVPGTNDSIGFSEVYWADIARKPAEEGYTLEEPRRWAKSLIERLRFPSAGRVTSDQGLFVGSVVGEMIETISVLKRLVFLAEKGGILRFDLDRLLTHYVNDVQVVTEFQIFRDKILEKFTEMLDRISRCYPEAELYIVAHSEGTVVSLLGLLRALTGDPKTYDWARQVRGFMTIGSPIDKHFFLWPELWQEFKTSWHQPSKPEEKIRWRNYYDKGDPVGFELDTARSILTERKFPFDFTQNDDIGFSRYSMPGKAHVDYWNDGQVFGHFIETVVKPPTPAAKGGKYVSKPGNRLLSQIIGYIMPYLIAATLLSTGVFFIFKAVIAYLGLPVPVRAMLGNILGFSTLLAGVTVVARIPRLTRVWGWHLIGAFIFLASGLIFAGLVDPKVAADLAGPLGDFFGSSWKAFFIWLGVAIAAASYLIGVCTPLGGSKPLLIPGAVAVTYIVVSRIWSSPNESDAGILSVLLAGGGFLYLWWLATLLFDLTFVWHRYIRTSRSLSLLQGLTKNDEDIAAGGL